MAIGAAIGAGAYVAYTVGEAVMIVSILVFMMMMSGAGQQGQSQVRSLEAETRNESQCSNCSQQVLETFSKSKYFKISFTPEVD